MKVYTSKHPMGGVAYRVAPDEATANPGEILVQVSPDDIEVWSRDRVWDDVNGPRLPNTNEQLEGARAAKLTELNNAFISVWDANYPHDGLGILLYTEFPSDPESVAVRAAKSNYVTKRNALRDLGKAGRPPLTEANIAGIVW